MILKFTRDTRVGELKKQFKTKYPFLKLEFLMPQRSQTGNSKQVFVTNSRRLSEINADVKEGAIAVDDNTTVKDLESAFRGHLLDVQVFRRSDNLWLETTMTDGWTLEVQNNHGKEISESKRATETRRFDNDNYIIS